MRSSWCLNVKRSWLKKPSWWNDGENTRYWVLGRCLPGQRHAAARFFDFLCEHLQALDMETTPLLPSLFRHKEKPLVLCSHVDDLILGGEREAVGMACVRVEG